MIQFQSENRIIDILLEVLPQTVDIQQVLNLSLCFDSIIIILIDSKSTKKKKCKLRKNLRKYLKCTEDALLKTHSSLLYQLIENERITTQTQY